MVVGIWFDCCFLKYFEDIEIGVWIFCIFIYLSGIEILYGIVVILWFDINKLIECVYVFDLFNDYFYSFEFDWKLSFDYGFIIELGEVSEIMVLELVLFDMDGIFLLIIF